MKVDKDSLGVRSAVILNYPSGGISQVMVSEVDKPFPVARLVPDGSGLAMYVNVAAEKDAEWLETLEAVYSAACDPERNPLLAEVISSLEQ